MMNELLLLRSLVEAGKKLRVLKMLLMSLWKLLFSILLEEEENQEDDQDHHQRLMLSHLDVDLHLHQTDLQLFLDGDHHRRRFQQHVMVNKLTSFLRRRSLRRY